MASEKRPGEGKTSIRRMQAAERQCKALQMRAAGVEYEAIARELGYASPSGAFKAVVTGLKKTLQEPADELRALETKRLDALLMACFVKAKAGDLKAIDRVVKISERRARLLGLDAPTKAEISVNDFQRLVNQVLDIVAEVIGTDDPKYDEVLGRLSSQVSDSAASD